MKTFLCFLPLLAMVMSATVQNEDAKGSAQRLQGVWKLVSYRSSIKRSQQWVGLMFLERGYFSRMYQEADRRKLDFNFETTAHLKSEEKEQLIDSFKQFRAGIGTYGVVGKTIIMKSTAIYNPNALGNEFSREFRFEGNKLILTGTTKVAGDAVEEVWERVE
jgi:hypothetical protein